MTEYTQFAQIYNSSELLKIIGAMQLLPQNHGKKVRLESLARVTVTNLNSFSNKVPISKFQEITAREYAESEWEDYPINLFTENVMFFSENYTVFPGITYSGTSILNLLLQTIFIYDKDKSFPKSYRDNIYNSAMLILGISRLVSEKTGFSYNYFEKVLKKPLNFPLEDQLQELKSIVTFSKQNLTEHFLNQKISVDLIDIFVTNLNDTGLLQDLPYNSPLNKKPFIKIEDEYILVQPISLVECLINFIWQEAKTQNCYDLLQNLFQSFEMNQVEEYARKMQWPLIDIGLPTSFDQDLFQESVFKLELNKLVYLCFIKKGVDLKIAEDNYQEHPQPLVEYSARLQKRQIEVLNHLSKTFDLPEQLILTVYIISDAYPSESYAVPSTSKDVLVLHFKVTEFKFIALSEEPDPLLLWKFARSYTHASEEMDLLHNGGMLDVFFAYKTNGYSLWIEGEEQPGLLVIPPGSSARYRYKSIIDREEHIAPQLVGGEMTYKFVFKYCTYAPFYMEGWDNYPPDILLEDFIVPIWFVNNQKEKLNQELVSSQLEMLAFWSYRLSNQLRNLFESTNLDPITINLIIDNRFEKEVRLHEVPIVDLVNIVIPVKVSSNLITLTIPLEMAHWYAKPHNDGERHVMLSFLKTIISEDKHVELVNVLDIIMPKGPAKMSSMLANANNLQMEKRFLPPYRKIQQADISSVQTSLTRNYGITIQPSDLSTTENKKKLSYKIATVIHQKIIDSFRRYEPESLLLILMSNNEACVQLRAIRSLDLPARIACLDSHSEEVLKLIVNEQERVRTALGLRCLIELIVAYDSEPIIGHQLPSVDDMDQLIALMNEMIAWATLSDGLNLGLYDPAIELLPCGRLKVDYPSINSQLYPFNVARSQNEILHHNEAYGELFDIPDSKIPIDISPELEEINQAFKADWGIEFLRLNDFITTLAHFTRTKNATLVCADESDLYSEILKDSNWSTAEISSALKALSLISGWKVGIPPQGFLNSDTYPWHYNRELSFIRRPIAKLTRNNRTIYYWSYRHLFAAFDNLLALLLNGSLHVQSGGELDKLVKAINTKKGHHFRNLVTEWLSSNSELDVKPDEVKIGPGELLNNTIDIGDIDIMAIDHKQSIIYSIECKNTVDAKVVHAMKTEMDKYLGRDGMPGMLQKHVIRDQWLKSNLDKLKVLLINPLAYCIKSVVITSEEIPTAYLKKEILPFPIFSFAQLRREGSGCLFNLKTSTKP
ncbi:hypothetical protein CNR22_23265 [Sphingobacteriaceae bacterium]|nr:hypothetical protein CNR22_23265 [Sphingobacteriaceae bacterium]